MENEKKAILLIYTFNSIMVMSIFLYLTVIRGYTPEENFMDVTLAVLLPPLVVFLLGWSIIERPYSKVKKSKL